MMDRNLRIDIKGILDSDLNKEGKRGNMSQMLKI